MADTIEETTSAYNADPKFQEYYNAIAAQLSPQTIEYQAPTIDEIAAQISGYLRPSTDAQIKARQQATIRQRAATDADAASRGMLSSTWVTDYKNRLAQQESSDIADVEAAYRAQLLQGVAARQQDEANRAYQIAMFNAQMRQAAESDAYKRAGDMYQIYLNGKGSGGGSGKTGNTPEIVDNTEEVLKQIVQHSQKTMGQQLSRPAGQSLLSWGLPGGYSGLRGKM